jgi:hypothetical protein
MPAGSGLTTPDLRELNQTKIYLLKLNIFIESDSHFYYFAFFSFYTDSCKYQLLTIVCILCITFYKIIIPLIFGSMVGLVSLDNYKFGLDIRHSSTLQRYMSIRIPITQDILYNFFILTLTYNKTGAFGRMFYNC